MSSIFPLKVRVLPIRTWFAVTALALGVSIFLLGLGGTYIFDDTSSIAPLRALQSNPDAFWALAFGDVSGPLGRSVSMLTFAVEQRFFGGSTILSQAVSISIHLANSCLVFWFLSMLLRLENPRRSSVIALVGALLWACAPQKVSTVLYMVQRMTLLAAFFTLTACCSYLYARTLADGPRRIVAGLICGASMCLAPFAKENGALVLPLILICELFMFPPSGLNPKPARLRPVLLLVFAGGCIAYLLLGVWEFQRAGDSYALRAFSIVDRVSLIPAVLFDYSLQFFFPAIDRMGIFHDDYVLANDQPVKTILGLVCLFASTIFLASVLKRQLRSAEAFGLSMFLLCHSIESTFLPLELYFEHRNYMPSVGLVLCFCAVSLKVASRLTVRTMAIVSGALVCYLATFMISTGLLSQWWSSTELLVAHHVAGHPDSARAHSENAIYQAASGHFEDAKISIDHAYRLSRSQPAARSMGPVDRALLLSAVACLAHEGELVPDVSFGELEGMKPIRGVSVRLLRQLYDAEECPDADWNALSSWIMSAVVKLERVGYSVGRQAMLGLGALEQARGDPTNVYLYGSMATEKDVGNGSGLLLMADAAIAVGDSKAVAEAMDRLSDLRLAGKLGAANELVLRKLQARID